MTNSWWDTEYQRQGKKPITPRRYLQKHAGERTDSEIAEYLSALVGAPVSQRAVTQQRQNMGLDKTRAGKPLFIESERPLYNAPPVIASDNVLVIADVHAPYHDAAWMRVVVAEAQGAGVRDCIVAGDLIDFQALSGFAPAVIAAEDAPTVLDGEIAAAGEIVEALLVAFDSVTVLLGNHELRLARRLGNLTVRFFERLIGAGENRSRVSEYHWCRIEDTAGGVWRVTHPRNASLMPVRVAARLTEKHETNVIAAHGHDWGEATGASGRYAAACGMCGDPARIDYATLEDSTRPLMQQGAWLLVDRQPVLLHPIWRRP